MTDPFTLRYESARNVVYFHCWGKWSADELQRYIAAYGSLLRSTRSGFISIVDNRRFEIQDQEIQAGLSEVIEMGRSHRPGPSFIIVDKAFQEMHVKRLTLQNGQERELLRFVGSPEEAERLVAELIASG